MSEVRRATMTDVAMAQEWNAARGGHVRPVEMFSTTGFAVPGIAAVWLYLTNSSLAYLDYIAANPKASSEERSVALDAVILAACSHAHACGHTTVIAAIDLPAVARRGERLGFAPSTKPLTLYAKPLGV